MRTCSNSIPVLSLPSLDSALLPVSFLPVSPSLGTCPFGPSQIHFPHYPVLGICVPSAGRCVAATLVERIRRAQPVALTLPLPAVPRTSVEPWDTWDRSGNPGLKSRVSLSTHTPWGIPRSSICLFFHVPLSSVSPTRNASLQKVLPRSHSVVYKLFFCLDSTSHHFLFLVNVYFSDTGVSLEVCSSGKSFSPPTPAIPKYPLCACNSLCLAAFSSLCISIFCYINTKTISLLVGFEI